MILEFVPYEDRDEVLLSMYIVEDVEWQVTARRPDELTAIAIVRRKTGFDS